MRSSGNSSHHPCLSRWQRFAAGLLLLAVCRGPAWAGGPATVTDKGEPFRWNQDQPIRYAVNPGTFGHRSHAWAVATLGQALRTWQAVPTARLQFQAASDLSPRVTADNVGDFLNGLGANSPSPILLDSDGSITDAVLGDGASDAVLGLGPYFAVHENRFLVGWGQG